jgi:hypothetical protein
LRLSADERKALLVAGAAAGMAATFNSPLAAILLAVELLLFEWRPRSFVPVVAAVAVATVCRGFLLGTAPVFPVNTAGLHLTPAIEALAVVTGLSGGLLAVGATWLVYRAEDAFHKLPVHWMWWPAIGGVIIGMGGLIEPRALGVGYDVIDELLTGRAALSLILGILIVKTLIWSLSLGSGTSGGVLAPVFMIGGAMGALEGMVFPAAVPGFWAMCGLAAVVGGVMRSPLTGVVFTLELTHAWNALLPLVLASTAAYALSVLILKRSVLTEKIARRGLHLTREYSTDPLETFFVHEVMTPLPADSPAQSSALTNLEGAPSVRADDTLRAVAYQFAETGQAGAGSCKSRTSFKPGSETSPRNTTARGSFSHLQPRPNRAKRGQPFRTRVGFAIRRRQSPNHVDCRVWNRSADAGPGSANRTDLRGSYTWVLLGLTTQMRP